MLAPESTGIHDRFIGLQIESAASMGRVGPRDLRSWTPESKGVKVILVWQGIPTQPCCCSQPLTQALWTKNRGVHTQPPSTSPNPQGQKEVMCLEGSGMAVWPSDSLQTQPEKLVLQAVPLLATILPSLSSARGRQRPDTRSGGCRSSGVHSMC